MIEVTQISNLLDELINSEYTEWYRINNTYKYKNKNIIIIIPPNSLNNNRLEVVCVSDDGITPDSSFALIDLHRVFGSTKHDEFSNKFTELQTRINEICIDLSKLYSEQKIDRFFEHLGETNNDNL